MKVDDRNIRIAVIERFKSYKNTKLYEEFTTPSGFARADIVLVNGHVQGYEIKSDFDNLNRLNSQIEEYDLCFEMNSIITTNKYFEKVRNIIPNYWGMILAEPNTNIHDINFKFLRRSKLNPHVNFIELICLLDADTLKSKINESHLNVIIGKTKTEVRKTFKYQLAEECNHLLNSSQKNFMIKIVREELKK